MVVPVVLVLLLTLGLLSGCGGGGGSGPVAGYIEGLYRAFVVGTTWRYDNTDAFGTERVVWSVVGTRNIGGTRCLDVRITEDGQVASHLYGTVSDATGMVFHAMGDPAGTFIERANPPAQMFPTNPPRDFSGQTTFFGLAGEWVGRIISTSASVNVPAGQFDNALRARLTIRASATGDVVGSVEYWLVPNVGPVRVVGNGQTLLDDQDHEMVLVSYTLGPDAQ
jgi:hypothetical protein